MTRCFLLKIDVCDIAIGGYFSVTLHFRQRILNLQ